MTRRKRYSKEFKREALRRANEEGMTDTLVAQELGFSTRQLRRWRDEATRHGEDAFPGQGNAHDKEMMLLKRENAKLRQERDFLKEAAAYFAKESK
jgi:transposase-like protein